LEEGVSGITKRGSKDIGEISEEEILRTVRTYRKEKRAPEITVVAET
jgi:hypothetical protein